MRNTTLALMLMACSGSSKTPPPAPVEAAAPSANEAVGMAVAKAMNPDVGACEDFYEYACGGWLKETTLPDDKPIVTRSFTTIYDENQEVVHGLLEKAAKEPGDDPVQQKLGTFYGSCMDTDAIEARGIEPLKPWLDKIDAIGDAKAAVALAGELQDFGPNPFFGMAVWADDKQPDMNILILSQDGLGLPDRDYYFPEDDQGKDLLAKYEAHVATMFGLFGDDDAKAKEKAKKVVEFETAIAKTHWKREEMRDSEKTYNKMTYDEAKKLAKGVNLDGFFAGAGIAQPPADVNVLTPSAFEGLGKLLGKTDAATLKAYMRWQMMHWAAPYMPAKIDEANFAFYGTELSGQTAQIPRWKRCVNRTDAAMGEWIGRAYVDLKFAGDSKATAESMVDGIFVAFRKNLPNLAWMDDETRAKAVEKAEAFVAKLGYPNKWKDYSTVELDRAKHLENVIAGNLFGTDELESKIGKPVDKDEWHMTPQMVNAYYNPPQNEIVFPAGIMQAPFFSADFPKAMNYGALGMVIGHEITHGFDDEGRKYAPTGELKEWWAPEVSEKFEAAAECVEKQYDGFQVEEELNVNGGLTLGENIADLGGLKVAHLAYLDWVEANGAEPELAGLTGEQQLFVAFAQGWCTVATPEIERMRVKTDPHSPPRFRVNGPVMNYPAFAKAFGCETGAPMAPEDVCVVW
ncbi:MAG: M13 family metallopeptidase [Alphaproteobacteria bacterium]|nr:M13 family metallopeptidase [Alphaproteobacteria bacterium]